MTAPRCRWHDDPGRCPDPAAFPGTREAPELCIRHLAGLDPWIAARARQPGNGDAWIRWAARQAGEAEQDLRALGLIRPARALGQGRPAIPDAPERR